jgi:uncharacterized membrane protein
MRVIMTPVRALQTLFAIGLAGVGFSGVLAYRELFGGLAACPAPGAPGTLFGYPACIYGFAMFAAIAIVSARGLYHVRAARHVTSHRHAAREHRRRPA